MASFYERKEEGWFLHSPTLDINKIYIEPTNRCNLSCITCVRNNWPGDMGDMSINLFEELINQIKLLPKLKEVVLGGFGEPLLHSRIIEMIEILKGLGLKVKITTNGMLLNEDMAKKLIELKVDDLMVSFDGFSEEKFSEIRKEGKFAGVRENVRALKELKEKDNRILPRVGVEFVMMKKNEEELKKLPSFVKELGIHNVLVTNLLPHTEKMSTQILYDEPRPPQEENLFSPISWPTPWQSFGSMGTVDFPRMKWGANRRCRFVEQRSLVVGFDGRVAPCYPLLHSNRHYVFDREKNITAYSFGNISEKTIDELWCDKEYTKFRNKIRLFIFPSCVDCSLANNCDYPRENEDCWGNSPSCADCLWAQDIIRCP